MAKVRKIGKSRALAEIARVMCGLGHKLNGNSGFENIARAVAQYQQRECPKSREEGWTMLMAFLGQKPPRTHDNGKRVWQRKPKAAPAPKPIHPATGDDFLQTYEWRRLRMEALKKYGARCQCCGATPATGAVMNVDHIKPRRLFPGLALDLANLQVLCGECNHGKGNWDMTDWRANANVS